MGNRDTHTDATFQMRERKNQKHKKTKKGRNKENKERNRQKDKQTISTSLKHVASEKFIKRLKLNY